ncbi:FIG019733: possible DNA-binding protein [hydrothermal vent metagenome]|uniref:FIG019733: possible DNA-binding protein n=1 Tax=hydrothermal vent metagenome TaxID=652676 RepID=A0A3B0S4L4_9ZZZZ
MTADRTTQRLGRILAVLPWIIEHDGADTDDVVERFGYKDTAELVRDLHVVFMTGLPGYGPGDLIDVDIFEDEVHIDAAEYFSRPLRLTAPEALGLLAAGMTLIQSDQAPEALHSAVEKLSRVVAPDDADTVYFDVPTPGAVGTLREAITQRRVVRIGYVGMASNARTVRDVEGHSVFFNLGNWYLSGLCRLAGGSRIFRVDRIDTLEILQDTYDRPDVAPQTMVQYQANESDEQVSFTLDPDASWVVEYYPADVEQLPSGSLRVTMSVADPLVAARLLLQLGDTVSEIDGPAIESTLTDLSERILARYASPK